MNARLGGVAAIGALPWSLVFADGELTLVFAFGLVDPVSLYATDVLTYTFVYTGGLPDVLFAWGFFRRQGTVVAPVGTLFCFAVVWWFDWPALRDALA